MEILTGILDMEYLKALLLQLGALMVDGNWDAISNLDP
jgi:hypothetical protein